jgi:hypothetical protein
MGELDQVGGVCVVVGRDLQRHALVHGPLGEAVELVAGDFEQGDAALGGDPDRVAYAVVVLQARGDVQGVGRDAGEQGLQDGVAAADVFGGVLGALGLGRAGAPGAAAVLAGDALGAGLVLVPVAHLGRRGRAPAFEPAAHLPAGALGGALLLRGPT